MQGRIISKLGGGTDTLFVEVCTFGGYFQVWGGSGYDRLTWEGKSKWTSGACRTFRTQRCYIYDSIYIR